jgi:putative ABC transport system permease protein
MAMWFTTLRSIRHDPRRFLATCTAVVLGVAFLTATLVIGDTVRGGFTDMFTDANARTAAVVRSTAGLGGDDTGQEGLLPASLVDAVRQVDGVAAAAGVIEGTAQIQAGDGTSIGGNGPPTVGSNWIEDPDLARYQLVDGRAPATVAPDQPVEVVIDRGSAQGGGLAVGDRTTVFVPDPIAVGIVGIVAFGDEDSMAGSTYAGFSEPTARELLVGGGDVVHQVRTTAEAGATEDQVAAAVATVLPADAEVLTGSELTAEELQQIEDDFLGVMTTFLVMFAGIALLVGSFSIHNTFAIVAAQRTRESALLRAIGATRRQVLGSVMGEAAAVGAVASAVGIGIGLALALGLSALLEAADVGLPTSALVLSPTTVAIGIVVGVGVTVLAAATPALAASRVAPVAAMRGAAVEAGTISIVRIVLGMVVLALGVVGLVVATRGDGDLAQAGLGALATLLGVVLVAPALARPVGTVLGTPGRLLRGVSGHLAASNATRNPRRTAKTASALMIGMAVVVVFTVFGASLRASIADEVEGSYGTSDLVVEATAFAGSGLSPRLAEELSALDGVEHVAGLSFGAVQIDGRTMTPTITDPEALDAVSDLGFVAGSLLDLGDDGVAVSAAWARQHGHEVGDVVSAGFADGATEEVRIAGIYEAKASLGDLVVGDRLYDAHAVAPRGDQVVLLGLADGVDLATMQSTVTDVATDYGAPTVRSRAEYIDAVAGQVNQLLTIVYVLLALAVIIAVLGIANTLALSIHERTRELGLLRAVGQTRRQMRTMVRAESIVVAGFGTLLGVGLGVLIGWGLVGASRGTLGMASFDVPGLQLTVVAFVGAAAGLMAAMRPARRAARLDVLTAIATD